MRLRLHFAMLTFVLLLPLICHAQTYNPDQPEAFAQLFVEAVNSKSIEKRAELLHPKAKACINAQTQPYYDWIFSRQSKSVISAESYKVSAKTFSPNGALPFDDKLVYPLRPTHQLQIDFETGPNLSASFILFIVRDGGRWYEVLPCPSPEAMTDLKAAEASRVEQDRKIQTLLAKLADPLRAEILALTQEGHRIEAIKRYSAATGEDLSTAKGVVDLLVPRAR